MGGCYFKYKHMRIQFVECKSRKTAFRFCPWASRSMKVVGGFLMFESISDYIVAKRSK